MFFLCCVLPCGRSSLDSVQRSRCLWVQVLLRGRQVRSIVGARSRYALVRSRVVPVSTRRTADATRCTQLERNERIHKAEKNTMQGAFTFLSYPMYCAPRHIHVLRSPRALFSHLTRVPRLSQITHPVHDLEISQYSSGPAPLGGDRYNYIQSKYRHNVQSTT